jgi:uncharacterized damage-inducible protein DinB
MILEKATFDVLNQLSQLLEQLDDEEYSRQLTILSGNTVGKHARHIVEFYICLLNGMPEGFIDYDARNRDLKLETDRDYILKTINIVNNALFKNLSDCPLKLSMTVSALNDKIIVHTTLYRELAYNIEHVVHHFALIRIAVAQAFSGIQIPENFGIAYSTINYNQQVCAQ